MIWHTPTFSWSRYTTGPLSLKGKDWLDRLSGGAFEEITPVRDTVESGLIAGDHQADVRFTDAKNLHGRTMVFGLRLDQHKVPSGRRDVLIAERLEPILQDSETGHATRGQKREAAEAVDRDLNEAIGQGRFRKTQVFNVWYRPDDRVLLFSGSSEAAEAALRGLMQSALGVELGPLCTAGVMAETVLSDKRLTPGEALGDTFRLLPASYAQAPQGAEGSVASGGTYDNPSIPWAKTLRELYDWLGCEWLIFLWYLSEIDLSNATERDLALLAQVMGDDVFRPLDRMKLQCPWGIRGKTVLESSSVASTQEAGDGLALGRWPRSMSLGVELDKPLDGFTLEISPENWRVSSVRMAPLEDDERPETRYAERNQRLDRVRQLDDALCQSLMQFVLIRTASDWAQRLQSVREWVLKRIGIDPQELAPAVVGQIGKGGGNG